MLTVSMLTSLLLTSCRTQYVVMPSSHTRDSVHLTTDHRMDSTFYFVHDSMSIRFGKVSSAGGNGIPDTVYVDRWHTAYKDRWHTLSHTDTIAVTQHDSIPYPVEVPIEVEKPIPRVYRYSLWFVILFLLYWLFRIAKAVYLRR